MFSNLDEFFVHFHGLVPHFHKILNSKKSLIKMTKNDIYFKKYKSNETASSL